MPESADADHTPSRPPAPHQERRAAGPRWLGRFDELLGSSSTAAAVGILLLIAVVSSEVLSNILALELHGLFGPNEFPADIVLVVTTLTTLITTSLVSLPLVLYCIRLVKRVDRSRTRHRQIREAVFSSLPLPTFTWRREDGDFVLVDHNEAASQITRGKVADLVGARASEIYADQPEFLDWCRQTFSAQSNATREIRYRFRTTGEERDLTVTIAFAPPDLVLVYTQDITERKRAETALRESQERYRSLVELSPDAILVHIDGRLIFANSSAVRLYRAGNVDRLIGRQMSDLVHPDDRPVLRRRMTELAQKGRHDRFVEMRHQCLDGGTFEGESIAARMEWDGRPGTIIVVRDITERKRSERAVRESEERFSAIFNNSPNALVLKGLDGRIHLVNKQFERWYGLTAAGVIGKTSHDIFPPELAAALVAQDQEVVRSGSVMETEQEVTFGDGSVHTAVITKFPVFDSDGRAIGIGGAAVNVSDQRRIETQLRQAQKMEAVGQLTGGLAHDFNNLLTVIHGSLELLEDEGGDERHRRVIEVARIAAERGAELTGRLLAFSRKAQLKPRAIAVDALLAGLVELLRRTMDASITIETVVPDGAWQPMADPAQLESALINLALNARDAMPDGGRLTIAVSNLDVGAEDAVASSLRPGPYVRLMVNDTGTGMPPEVRDHAFEPFFTTKEVGKGSGLGLSMVYGFARQSNGHVDLESAPGRGTTVALYLPRATGESRAVHEQKGAEQTRRHAGTGTILVVEDDAAVREIVVDMVRGLGYQTVEAEDGVAALEVLERRSDIKLLFSDIVLPNGMSGVDIAREARARHPGLRIIFTSGYSRDALKDIDLGRDPVPIIHKPYRRRELAETLAGVLG